MQMPTIAVTAFGLTSDENAIQMAIRKSDGTLRKSKPRVTDDPTTGRAAYVWRMVAFYVSPMRRHQCMPVTADFDLPAYGDDGKWSCAAARAMAKTLDALVDEIVNEIPKAEWHGVRRWGQAFGSTGTATMRAQGTVVYR